MVQPTDLPRNQTGIDTVLSILKQQFPDQIQTGQALRDQHGHTTTWIRTQAPDAVLFPKSTEEIANIIKICAIHKVPVIPYGTGTSLEGQVNAPAGGICLDLSEMNRIIAVNSGDLDCVVEPGVTREQLNTHLRDQGLFFPIDPGANASLGGMASTRASGTNAVRYGTMKDNVLAVEAVMPDGTIIRTAQRARKSSAGYDLTRLLVGAEGTLGLITRLTLRLHGIPEQISAARCSFPTVEAACETVMAVIQYGIPVARIELLDALTVKAVNAYSKLDLPETPLLLIEFHGSMNSVREQADQFGAIAEENGGTGYTSTTSTEERNRLWQARHDAYWAQQGLRPGAKGIATDVCVPISRLAECVSAATQKVRELGLVAPIVGHAGDGNFHAALLVDMDDPKEIETAEYFVGWLNELAISMDGTCTGEHGIGQGKKPYLQMELGPAAQIMARIKTAIDPLGIMNPGKIF